MKFDTRGMQAAGMSTAEINRAITAGKQRLQQQDLLRGYLGSNPRYRVNAPRPQRTPPKRTSSR